MSDDPLQQDWAWITKVLEMCRTRVLDGQRVILTRPSGFSKTADIKWTVEEAMIRMIKETLSTAEVVDAE